MSDTPRTFGSLFAGIGGIDLGLERSGLVCKWQVEIDPYCQKVLKKHWPNVPLHDDVKTFPPGDSSPWRVDLIAAGFPCQDISLAGKGAGIHGERSALFFDAIRIAGTLRPRWLLLENVPAILSRGRGMGIVLSELAEAGYDVGWQVLSAADVGARHLRRRVFFCCTLADSNCQGLSQRSGENAAGPGQETGAIAIRRGISPGDLPDSQCHAGTPCGDNPGVGRQRESLSQGEAPRGAAYWDVEPPVGRVADGVPSRVDRLRGIGNAVVPQCIEELCRQWGWVTKAHSTPGDESSEPTDDSPPLGPDPRSQSQ